MAPWLWTSLLLCLYGFLKELRPSEPYLTQYLIEPQWVNITLDEAYNKVYPVWTYSYLAVLVPVFLLTDWARYKAVIVIEGIAYIVTWSLLLWGHGVAQMQFMQFAYGVATSTEVAYYTYIYAQVSPEFYKRVTSFTRSSLLMGRFISGVLAQVLISTHLVDYRQLNIITLASVCLAAIVALALPSVRRTIYFHKDEEEGPLADTPSTEKNSRKSKILRVLSEVKRDFVCAFWETPYVFKWSLWWSLAMCGNFQVGNYIQPLWETISPSVGNEDAEIYNGIVEAATTLTGALLAFAFGYIHLNWSLIGEPTLSLISFLDGGILCGMALATSIWPAYVGYWAFRALYQMLITVASFEVASNIREDSYGLVFGFNTFMALLFQSILTFVVCDDNGLALPPRTQFLVYGGFWLVIGLLFAIIFALSLIRHPAGCIGGFKARYREGIWANGSEMNGNGEGGNAKSNRHCRQKMRVLDMVDDAGRREVPLGPTEQI